MAILLRGKTECRICGDVIKDGDEVILFPHVVLNEADPLYSLSDAACHRRCVESDVLGARMMGLSTQFQANSGPGKRTCAVCGSQVGTPDDYLFIGYLGDGSDEPLGQFNYTHLHKSHISTWKEAGRFLSLAKDAIASGKWQGSALAEIVREIEANM
jgi:hypothetical protein